MTISLALPFPLLPWPSRERGSFCIFFQGVLKFLQSNHAILTRIITLILKNVVKRSTQNFSNILTIALSSNNFFFRLVFLLLYKDSVCICVFPPQHDTTALGQPLIQQSIVKIFIFEMSAIELLQSIQE